MDETAYNAYDIVKAFLAYCAKNRVISLPYFDDPTWHLFLCEITSKFDGDLPLIKSIVGNCIVNTTANTARCAKYKPTKQKGLELIFATRWEKDEKTGRIVPTPRSIKETSLMAELENIEVVSAEGLPTNLMEKIFRHAKREDYLADFVQIC
jgi:hypothetical protein